MGARLICDFVDGRTKQVIATVYDHWAADHKTAAKAVLKEFIKAVKSGTVAHRFEDPSYLAAKFVVHRAMKYAQDPAKLLEFLSVGILPTDGSCARAGETWARVICHHPEPKLEFIEDEASYVALHKRLAEEAAKVTA